MLFNRSKTLPDPSSEKGPVAPPTQMEKAQLRNQQESRVTKRQLASRCPVSIRKGQFSLPGRKREDRVVTGARVFEKGGATVELHLVVDGHGGAQVADFLQRELPLTIAKLCLERTADLETNFKPREQWSSLLKEAFSKCSDDWDRFAQTHAEKKSGAVLTLILHCGTHCFVAHVGDGKVVASYGDSFRELTTEHRACNLEEKTRIEQCGGCVVNDRVRGVLAPSRAFGDILVRLDNTGQLNNTVIRPEPELISFDITRPGYVVVGTDGLFDVTSSGFVSTTVSIFLAGNSDADAAAQYLAEHASKRTDDDVSVIVLMWT